MALLFPAINAAREQGRANTCRNQIRNLAFAIVGYQDQKNHYPAIFANAYAAQSAQVYRPLVYAVLPQLGYKKVYDNYRPLFADLSGTPEAPGLPGQQIDDPDYIEVLVCPSDTQRRIGATAADQALRKAPMSYVFNAGRTTASASLPAAPNPADGVFLESGFIGQSDVLNGDGLGTTLMLGENLDAGSWNVWDWDTSTGAPTKGHEVEFVWWDVDNTQWQNHGINARPTNGTSLATDYRDARPSSNHGGGANFAFCGSNVQFISEEIDYQVLVQLMTSKSSQSLPTVASGVNLGIKLREDSF